MSSTEVFMPRIDRLASIYLSHPLARVIGAVSAARVPILMYHSISDNLFGKSHPYYQINTSPASFCGANALAACEWLPHAGPYANVDGDGSGQDLSKTVVITFDDGYRDFYTDAFDAMRQCGFTATIFLATDRIKDSPVRIEGVDYLTWSEVSGNCMPRASRFGSHTVTHPDLRSLGPGPD